MSLIDSVLWRDSPFLACPGLPPMPILPAIPSLADQALRAAADSRARCLVVSHGTGGGRFAKQPEANKYKLLAKLSPGVIYEPADFKKLMEGVLTPTQVKTAMHELVRTGELIALRPGESPGRYQLNPKLFK